MTWTKERSSYFTAAHKASYVDTNDCQSSILPESILKDTFCLVTPEETIAARRAMIEKWRRVAA